MLAVDAFVEELLTFKIKSVWYGSIKFWTDLDMNRTVLTPVQFESINRTDLKQSGFFHEPVTIRIHYVKLNWFFQLGSVQNPNHFLHTLNAKKGTKQGKFQGTDIRGYTCLN